MNKIPLEATIIAAFRFLFTRILSVLGTVWLPSLVMAGLAAGVVWLVVPHAWFAGQFPLLGKEPNFQQVWQVFAPIVTGFPLIGVICAIGSAMMTVGLMRLSLGLKDRTYVFFSLGADVWRLIGAYILAYLLFMLLFAVAVGVFAAALALVHANLPKAGGVLLLVVLGIAEVFGLIYVGVRWFFFIPAVVVAEHRIGLGRSWELGGGNFWRIFVIGLLISFAVGIAANLIMQATVMPLMMGAIEQVQKAPKPENLVILIKAFLPLLPAIWGIGLLQALATMGLMAGAVGSAYKALTGPAKEVKVPA